MSLTYAKGNLLSWPDGINVIAHGCNSFGGTGVDSRSSAARAGLAAQIATRYPDAAMTYRQWCENAQGGRADLGTLLVTPVDDRKRRIVWAVTQDEVGRHKRQLSYDALLTSMEALRGLLEEAHKAGRTWRLGLPMWIGGGLAGGDAATIQALLEHVWTQSPVTCVVVEWVRPAKDVQA